MYNFVTWSNLVLRRYVYTNSVICGTVTTKSRTHIMFGTFTANSHLLCLSHVVPLPWRAAKDLNCVFPFRFIKCGHVWFTHAMPRLCHVMTMPFCDFSRPRHGAAWAWYVMCELASAVQRRHVGDLPAFGFFRLPRGVPRSLLSEAYQSVKV
jgi:hypothetical protein